MLERIREVAYDSALKKFVLRKEGSGKRIEVPVGGGGDGVGEALYVSPSGSLSILLNGSYVPVFGPGVDTVIDPVDTGGTCLSWSTTTRRTTVLKSGVYDGCLGMFVSPDRDDTPSQVGAQLWDVETDSYITQLVSKMLPGENFAYTRLLNPIRLTEGQVFEYRVARVVGSDDTTITWADFSLMKLA